MKQPKKIIISLLVVVMLIFCTFTAFAIAQGEDTFAITVSSKYGTVIEGVDNTIGVQKDSVVDFSVTADPMNTPFALMMLTVTYDPDALQLNAGSIKFSEAYVEGTDCGITNDAIPGRFELNYLSHKGLGEMAKFSFTVKDTHGNTEVKVEAHVYALETYADVPVTLTGATTTIGVHSYGEAKTVNPDCLNGGYTYRACTVEGCEETIILARTGALDHKYGAWEVTAAPTVDAAGLLTKTCERDATHTVTFELPKLSTENGYTYAITTPEKCEVKGVGTYSYSKDGQSFTFDVERDALEHKYGAWVVTTAPTVDATGLLTKTCEHDATHTVTFELPKLSIENGYTYAITTPEKCGVKGVGTYTFEKDGQNFTFDVERAALDHKYGAWVLTTVPTVNETGLLTKTCEHDATHTVTFELPKLSTENSYSYEIITPETCETAGVGKFTYVKDGQTFAYEVERAALDHKYGAWVLTTAPTVDATGLLTKTCEHDATHTVTFELPKLSTENGYTYAITTPEKCETTGMGKFTYTKDGQTFEFDVERAVLGHKYGAWVVTTAPTVDATGLLTKTCEHDATHTVTFELPKLSTENGYTYAITTPEKCEVVGVGTYTYTKDGQTFEFDVERAVLGHKYGAWTLTTAATVDATGLLTKTCEHDATHTVTFELPKLSTENGYTYEIVVNEDCVTAGMGKFTYVKDTETFTFDVERAALGHDESGAAATCTTDKVCARGCGAVLQAKLGHDDSGEDATMTSDKVCARGCGEILEERNTAGLVILIIVIVLVVAGGGFAAYWFLIKKKKATK